MTNGPEEKGFLEQIRNSPRTVSTIIVILIVVGAIFAFSDRREEPQTTGVPTEIPAASPVPTETPAETPAPTAAPASTERSPTPAPAPAIPANAPLPAAEETTGAYVEVAAPGEGVTHLARRAVARYLEANPADFSVTAEHRIWIEDFAKDRIGSRGLAVGEQVTVEKDLIREAIGTSKTLTDAQLKNLERFSQRVAAYRS